MYIIHVFLIQSYTLAKNQRKLVYKLKLISRSPEIEIHILFILSFKICTKYHRRVQKSSQLLLSIL